ncbi:MAG TPA: glycosyltransferase family 39 protein [Chthoniobacterales bacterium]|nr:glycosyltransferase family 39 protein [Chthoniobacterales bacterium]
MSSGARTFGLHETFAEPEALPPPPVRHALLLFLVALAAILHIGTAGWSEIHNGAEGLYAASARQMLAAETSLLPRSAGAELPNEPPLLHWLLLASFKLFGVTALAARLPIALGFVAAVALTFLIGERLADYWRGFVAGLIFLCSCGAYLWGRFVTPEPLFAAWIAAAVWCAIGGYQDRRSRRRWFAGFWCCVAGAYVTRGAFAVLVLAVIIGLPAVCFREARLRFAALFHWPGLMACLLGVSIWLLILRRAAPGSLLDGAWLHPLVPTEARWQIDGVPLLEFLAPHLFWWFPAILVVVPGIIFAWRKIIRPQEFDFAEAVPLCWVACGVLLFVFVDRHEYDFVAASSGFALFAATAWQRTSHKLRLTGLALVAVGSIAAAFAIRFGALVLPGLGAAAFDRSDVHLLIFAGVALAVCCAAAMYLTIHGRETLAIAAVLVALVPIGLGIAERIARNGPHLSFGRVADFLQTAPFHTGEVLFEGSRAAGSSLNFYLARGFSHVADVSSSANPTGNRLTSAQALERMGQPEPAYLIIHKERVPWWQAQLTERFHIYHQVTTCGSYVVVNNHP